MITDQDIRITAQLLDLRESMRTLYGDAYKARIQEIRPLVEARAAKTGESDLSAAIGLSKDARERAPALVPLILATAVEMAEGGV